MAAILSRPQCAVSQEPEKSASYRYKRWPVMRALWQAAHGLRRVDFRKIYPNWHQHKLSDYKTDNWQNYHNWTDITIRQYTSALCDCLVNWKLYSSDVNSVRFTFSKISYIKLIEFTGNKANLRDLIAATGLVILLKYGSNCQSFCPWNLEIWRMTLKNNRAPLPHYVKHCASFQSHRRIQTGVTVWKRSIRVKIGDFLSRVTLKFDGWS